MEMKEKKMNQPVVKLTIFGCSMKFSVKFKLRRRSGKIDC